MTAPKPPPRTLQPAEERKIQLFLEKAAAIVLENPQLSAERLERLSLLANELDLTADEFRSTLDDLLNRGVIKRLEVVPPKPPPLPGRKSVPSATPGEPPEGFALTAPGEPPIQPPVAAPVSPQSPRPTSGHTPQEAPSALPLKEKEKKVGSSDSFLERATAILAEFQGWNPKSQALIAAIAKEMGLDDAVAQEALNRLRRPANVSEETADGAGKEKPDVTRWRVEGAPPPVPPPPPQSPAETFLDFARPSLAAVRDGVVSEDLENRLIAHGTRILGLSNVYARHLLMDLVTERRMRLASAADTPPTSTTEGGLEPRLQAFLQVAAPVLAQHRGLNPQSRMLLTALAQERGLTEQDMERAIASMNAREPADAVDRVRQERLNAFKSFLAGQLKKIGRGILSPALNDKLLSAGIDSHGLDVELASGAIREIAETLHLAVVTHEQAERHLTELLADLLPPGTPCTPVQRERIELEGAQWGLAAARIAGLLENHLRQNEQRIRSEERLSRWALGSAVVAVVAVIAFLVWAATARNDRRSESSTAVSTPIRDEQPATVTKPVEPSWLEGHSDLSIAIINARSDVPTLKKSLVDVGSNNPARRISAYESLVEHFRKEESHRETLADLLSRALAAEPSDENVAQLTKWLLQDLPNEETTQWDATDVRQMFQGVRTIAASLAFLDAGSARAQRLNADLQRASGTTPQPSRSAQELEQSVSRGLTEKLFQSLIAAAAKKGSDLPHRHQALVSEAATYADPEKLRRWNAQFAVAALGADPALWPSIKPLVHDLVNSKDALSMLQLVELYETTTDATVRNELGEQFASVFPSLPTGKTVEEVAASIRESLGVRDSDDPEGILRRLTKEVSAVLKAPRAAADPAKPLLAEVLQLAHYATLVCAFAQNEWSNAAVADLRKAGPKSPEPGSSAEAEAAEPPTSTSTSSAPDLSTRESLRTIVLQLVDRRTAPAQRLAAVESLGRISERVPELSPEMAAAVANYLLLSKSNAEHERVVELVPKLIVWTQLLVAVADRLDDASLTSMQLQTLLSAMVGSDVTIGEMKTGRQAARRRLLQFVRERLAATPAASARIVADPAENTATQLAEYYLLQAKLTGVSLPDDVAASRDPVLVLQKLIAEFQSRLGAAALKDAQQAELNRIPHEVAAVEFVAGNEVERCVLLERIWLRLLGLEVSRRDPGRYSDAAKLVETIQNQDRKSNHLLIQLRDGQLKLLEMWLLIAKRG